MAKRWSAYPRYRGETAPDPNIDHRRVPNQRAFFATYGRILTTNNDYPNDWQPGDIVEWKLPSGLDHTGILTDKRDADGFPYVVHNIGAGPQEEDVLRSWRVTAHFRYPN